MICTFFGHRDAPLDIEPILKIVLVDLILNKNINKFYVGNNGIYDSLVKKVLKELKTNYPQIEYNIVLAYKPFEKSNSEDCCYENTIYPEKLEKVPPKFAISKRNEWMIEKSDFVVVYVKHNLGGASKFKELAERKGKIVINICDKFPYTENGGYGIPPNR